MDRRILQRIGIALVSLVFAAAVSGCYESPHVTLAKGGPGHYNGPVDPLLAKLKTKQLQGELRARFHEAETDR